MRRFSQLPANSATLTTKDGSCTVDVWIDPDFGVGVISDGSFESSSIPFELWPKFVEGVNKLLEAARA